MKVIKNATSFGLEKQFKDMKISATKNKIQANNLDALAIIEWLEQKSETKNFIEVLRGLAYTIKTTQGLEDALDLSIKNAEKSFNEKMLIQENDSDYIKTVKNIICETNLVLEFCEEIELDVCLEAPQNKEKVLIDKQEYIKLMQNSNKNRIPTTNNEKVKNDATKKEEKAKNDLEKQTNPDKEKHDVFLHTFVKKYNSHTLRKTK